MIEFALPALLLGLKHSFDPDHLIAVSNILTDSSSLKNSIKLSLNWTFGHIGGAVLVTLALFLFKDSLLVFIADRLDIITALMLIGFGLLSVIKGLSVHSHGHEHSDGQGPHVHSHPHTHLGRNSADHSHAHIFGIGLVQGLASNDELLLLLVSFVGLASIPDMVFGVVVFSIGVFLGMMAFCSALSLGIFKGREHSLNQAINLSVGVISIAYGVVMFRGIGLLP